MAENTHDGEIRGKTSADASDGDGASRFLRGIGKLRGVRHRHKGKLDLPQAISAAREQGAAFERWRETGTLLKRIQVWTENQLLITVHPEIANLRSVQFDAPSRENAVMQVLKADEGEEPIVLFNLPLDRVRTCGFEQTIDIPSGQRLRLKISPEVLGWFEMVVAFVTEESRCELPRKVAGNGNAKAARAAAAGEPWRGLPHVNPVQLLSSRSMNYVAWGCIILVAASFVIGASLVNTVISRSGIRVTLTRDETRSQPSSAANSSVAGAPVSESAQPPKDRSHVTVRYKGGTINKPRASLTVTVDSACPVPFKKEIAAEKPAWTVQPKADNARLQVSQPVSNGISSDVSNKSQGGLEPEVLTPWDTQSQIKLAALRYVHVKVDDTSKATPSELQTLRASFVQVLKDKAHWQVVDSNNDPSPEATIKLGFEPDKTCLGVVLVEIRDVDGKLLWQALVGCRALPKQEHGAMFADASARLISKLQDKLELSQNGAKPAARTLNNRANFGLQ